MLPFKNLQRPSRCTHTFDPKGCAEPDRGLWRARETCPPSLVLIDVVTCSGNFEQSEVQEILKESAVTGEEGSKSSSSTWMSVSQAFTQQC